MPVLQVAHVKVSPRRFIFRPPQEHVAGRLHDALTFHDPLARVTFEFRPEALEHGLSRFFHLKEQRSTVTAHEQADGTEGPHTSNADNFEGDVLERVALDQATPLRRKAGLIRGKYTWLLNATPRVPLCREMINRRRSVLDPRLFTLHQVWKIVVLFEMSRRLGNDGVKFLSQCAVLHSLDFLHQIDLAVPDFQR